MEVPRGFTDAQLEAGIVNALRAGNMDAVRDILLVLSAQNPKRAVDVYDTLRLGVDIASDWLEGEEMRRA